MVHKKDFPSPAKVAAALEALLAQHPKGMRSRDTYEPLALQFGLTTEQRRATRHQLLGDGETAPYWANRIQNARLALKRAGKLGDAGTGVWVLKGAVAAVDVVPAFEGLEGAYQSVTFDRFERDPALRAACLAHHGTTCLACGLDMAERYGEIGRGFVHVHHTTPLSSVGEAHKVDARSDLVPLCPNCHAMVHRREPPLSVAELKAQIRHNAPRR